MSNGAIISKENAKILIQKFQSEHSNMKKAFRYDANLIRNLLDSSTSTDGIRIYMGKKTDGDHCVVLVGVDTNGSDLTDNLILEMGSPCPVSCDVNSYFLI